MSARTNNLPGIPRSMVVNLQVKDDSEDVLKIVATERIRRAEGRLRVYISVFGTCYFRWFFVLSLSFRFQWMWNLFPNFIPNGNNVKDHLKNRSISAPYEAKLVLTTKTSSCCARTATSSESTSFFAIKPAKSPGPSHRKEHSRLRSAEIAYEGCVRIREASYWSPARTAKIGSRKEMTWDYLWQSEIAVGLLENISREHRQENSIFNFGNGKLLDKL